MKEDGIAAAQARSTRARGHLADALAELKQRLLPRTIARNLMHGVSDKSSKTAKAGTEAVRAHPGLAVGLAALTALFFARKPIIRAISSTDDETAAPPARSPH